MMKGTHALVAQIMGWKMVWFDRLYDDGDCGWSQTGPHDNPSDCRHTAIAYWQEPNGASLLTVDEFDPDAEPDFLPILFNFITHPHDQIRYLDELVQIVLPYAHYELKSVDIWKLVTATATQHTEAFIRTFAPKEESHAPAS